jgi:hypothetical protein
MAGDYAANGALRESLAAIETGPLERIEKVETTLLTEFHKYAQASERRMMATEVVSHNLSERVAAIEIRVRELERKR